MTDAQRSEITRGTPGYPQCLEDVPEPPETLYVIGDPATVTDGLGVIGARRSTPYGLQAARLFAGWAGGAGYPVVSGAARGCDAESQLAAIDAGGVSVAVVGCGADVDYPRSSAALLARLRAGHGAVVSELPWGHPPARWTFPRRNRLIAALSRVLVVVEAGLPSGTFSTADFALDAGRDVLVVPGSIFAPESRGTNRLMRQGATPITDISELAEALRATIGPPRIPAPAHPVGDSADRVVRAVQADPMRPDDLARLLDMDIVDVARHLGRLEATGRVARMRDGRYAMIRVGG